MNNYFEMYLKKSKEHKFTPSAVQEIVRYLLVNGLIPINDENLDLMGDKQFHISGDHVPEEIKNNLIEQYLKDPWAGEFHEEHEIEELEKQGYKLDGIWIKGGEIEDFRMLVKRKVIVETSFDFTSPKPGDPPVVYYDCFRELHPMERVKQDWEKSNLCPHCGHEAEQGTEGSSCMYEDGSCSVTLECCGKGFYVLQPKEEA